MHRRLLFVDDEPGIRETLPTILRMHDFDVITAATVIEALQTIAISSFDVLISDLNIGHPGDGFMVFHAMRRTHPECVTMILTGFPAFESALQAIKSQVDDYLVKPANPTVLVEALENILSKRPATIYPDGRTRIASVLRGHVAEVAARTLQMMKNEPPLDALPLSDQERANPVQPILEEAAAMLEAATCGGTAVARLKAAEFRGRLRQEQGYTLLMLVDSARILEKAIFEVIHENMLALDLSFLMVDLGTLNDMLALQLKASITAFVEAKQKVT